MKNNEKKNNKRLLLLILLLLIGISGLIGYGVYSYYYTTGTIHTGSDEIQIASFEPTIYYNNDNHFLHGTHYLGGEINCSLTSYNSGSEEAVYTCTDSLGVNNGGSNPITLVGENLTLNYDSSNSGNITVSNETITYSENYNNVQPGETGYLYLSATVTVSNVNVNPSSVSSDAQYAYSPVFGADVTSIYFSYDVTATEVHN